MSRDWFIGHALGFTNRSAGPAALCMQAEDEAQLHRQLAAF